MAPSDRAPSLNATVQEAHYLEIDGVMLYLEEARRRTERAAEALRAGNAEPHLVDALERVRDELSESARRFRQGTFFAVPEPQLAL